MTVTEEERKELHKLLDQMLDENQKCMVLQRAWIEDEHLKYRRFRVYLNVE